jgi:HlyD family secretion protein
VARSVATAEESDRAIESLHVAQAGVARAEAALLEGRKQLITAERNLDYRHAVLADTRVTAPFDGLIVRRYRDPGDIVVPGSPALTLVSLEEVWISAWVDETEMSRLRVGQPARVVFRSEPQQGYQGEVARLGREADRETREFVVDVRVLKLPENWAVGQRAEVYIETDRKPSVAAAAGQLCRVASDQCPACARWPSGLSGGPSSWACRTRETAEIAGGLGPATWSSLPAGNKPS